MTTGEKDLSVILRSIKPALNQGEYVFCSVPETASIRQEDIISYFKEKEGYTLILEKAKAEASNIHYSFVAAWITLTVHSSLEAVGLTAAFSNALAANGISCNVVAAFYHDHIFVPVQDAEKAMRILETFAGTGSEQ